MEQFTNGSGRNLRDAYVDGGSTDDGTNSVSRGLSRKPVPTFRILAYSRSEIIYAKAEGLTRVRLCDMANDSGLRHQAF